MFVGRLLHPGEVAIPVPGEMIDGAMNLVETLLKYIANLSAAAFKESLASCAYCVPVARLDYV